MATDNHTLDGLDGLVAMLIPATLRHAVGFIWRGREGAQGVFEAWIPWLQVGLILLVLGGVGVVAVENTWIQALGGVLAVSGSVILATGLVMAAAVGDTMPSAAVPAVLEHPDAEGELVAHGEGLWTVRVPLRFYGMPFCTRMAVVDTGAGLLLFSPVEATPERVQAVQALGTVRWIVAPNPMHHLFVQGWIDALDDVTTVAAPGLPARRGDVRWDVVLEDGLDAPWPDEHVAVEVFAGHPSHPEIVLMHRPTSTLLVADLILNLGHPADGWRARERSMLSWFCMERRPGPPTDYKLTVDDPQAVAAAADRVGAWEPQRILPCHGPPILENALEVWHRAFAFAG